MANKSDEAPTDKQRPEARLDELPDIIHRARAIDDARNRGGAFGKFPPSEALALAWAVRVLADRERTPPSAGVSLSRRNPAPDAAQPMVPTGEFREIQLGGSGALSSEQRSKAREELELIRSVLYGFPAGLARNDALRAVHALLDATPQGQGRDASALPGRPVAQDAHAPASVAPSSVAASNVECVPEYFAKPGVTEVLAKAHPVLLVRQMAHEILRLRLRAQSSEAPIMDHRGPSYWEGYAEGKRDAEMNAESVAPSASGTMAWRPASETPESDDAVFIVRDADGQLAFSLFEDGRWNHVPDADCGDVHIWLALPNPPGQRTTK